MATVLRHKKDNYNRQFRVMLLFFGILMLGMFIFMNHREREHRIKQLHYSLKLFNNHVGYMIWQGKPAKDYLESADIPELNGIRLTLIHKDGSVLYDSRHKELLHANLADRGEVQDALDNGSGYVVRRLSQFSNDYYFFSASRYNDTLIIRSALPSNSKPLMQMTRLDNFFSLFIFVSLTIIILLAYLSTRKFGRNVKRMREFALRAESGLPVDQMEPFPEDDLGESANYILQLYSHLQQTKQELEQRNSIIRHQQEENSRIKKQLTQNLNHELKTPVSSIQGYMETLLNNPNISPETQTNFIRNSYVQSNRLSQLLKDISTITRMDEAGDIIGREELDLALVIKEMLYEVTKGLTAKNIKVHCSIPSSILMTGNQSLMYSAFRNLTDNAIAYSGCSEIYIELIESSKTHYHFRFADNGVGIEREHSDRIFERFYRIDKGRSRKMGGTGLGLSIVKNAIVLHGGSIIARDREGGGLEFLFSIRKSSSVWSAL